MSRAAADATPSTGVETQLTFIIPQDDKPYFKSSALTGTVPEVHFQTERRPVLVGDMRALGAQMSLDEQGFELHDYPSEIADFYDDEAIQTTYEQELKDLLKKLTGADEVAVFDATRRSDAPDGAANPDGQRGPADRVHVDYTVKSGPQRAKDALGEARVEEVLAAGGRIVQVNVWRPIKGPVRRTPLALADASSIETEQLVATDQLFPDRTGEIYQLAYGSGQRWYWVPEMTPNEVLLIKGWDSLDDGRAQFTPHGAFNLPGQEEVPEPRESIEVRTYLIFNA